ncbi:hypothetical protein HPB48_016693 [Haemaphysalis longicornis]|uniref:Uncharacterized protein n=1 Tax=Haemaphysalis longicornis TaxID=44386 RepID=A0A9J6G3R5_HAELO|nr:hypothetical protein HPB48_016693 [Haemaphysalis longicornis]
MQANRNKPGHRSSRPPNRNGTKTSSVSTFRMSALTKLRGLQYLRIQDTDNPLRAYLAAPTDFCRGVIHGVKANTPPENS